MLQDLRHINRPLLERLSPACAGQTSDDLADIQVMRDDWIRIKAQEMSREGRRALTLRLGTFNVNGKMPSQDLSAWVQGNTGYNKVVLNVSLEPPTLPLAKNMSPLSLGEVMRNPFDWITRAPKSSSKLEKEENKEEVTSRVDLEDPEDPDLFVFGFQELDLSTEALIYSTSTLREDAWCHAIFAALGEKASKYEKLASRQLVGMLILVIVKQGLKDCFGEVKTASAGAGILGVMGNKGGTAVRLAFTPPVASKEGKTIVGSPGSTTLTFVNAHLAAFDEMVDKRNLDFHDLSKRLAFENTTPNNSFSPALSDQGSDNGNIVNETGISAMGTTPPLSVYETDALFWMGDLNYRVDIPDLDMRRLLRDDEWDNGSKFEALLRFDQLKKAMQANKAFAGFQEFKVAHMPTYRFSPGLAMDKLGYDIKRKPAWTDRILYMHGPFCKVNQVSYTSHPQIMMSDHRPVAADFVVDVGHYDTEVHQQNVYKLFNDVTELDGEGAHQRGGLKVEDTFVDFDKIYHGKPVERKLLVKNVGKSPYAFRFVPIQVDSPIHPEWLQIHPMAGVLLPDEVTEIILRAYVDDATASILNLRPKDLSGTLILHTVLGKDHFISVSGEYQYTCFANKLSRLTRLRGSIRSMESPNDILPENNPINAPREVMRLDGMFVSPGDETIVDEIRECLDTGAEFPYSASASDPRISVAFASTLLRFLDALPEPIIPASLHPQCIDMSNRDEAFELLDALPPASVNVWISVTAFLHFICQSSATEQMAVQIAVILAPILLKDDPNSPITPISPKAKSQFLFVKFSEFLNIPALFGMASATIIIATNATDMAKKKGSRQRFLLRSLVAECVQQAPVVVQLPTEIPFSNLPTLPNLRSFSISIPTSSWGQPAIVTAVARLIAQSRHLVRLEINIQTASILDIFTSVNTSGTRLALEHLSLNRIGVTREGIAAALPHLMKLVSLKLLSDPNVYGHSVSVTDIWTPFLQRKIWLKSIAIDCGSDESFQSYVQVAPGIAALVLQASSRHPPIVQGVRSSPTLISILESISPYLAESLVELDIVPPTIQYPTDWNWPYDEQLLKLLASLHRLERLGVHVDYSSCGASELSKYMGEKVIDPFLKMSNDFTNLKTIILAFHYPSYALDWEREAIKTQVKDAIRAHPITSATFKGCLIEFEDAVFALRQCVNCGHHHYDYL
ncbi:hypothetical protein NLJ89_g8815 [Agrocybe chaxingu]|uniref:Rho-GAP domain-containing protein n=1 Tax=Agrocybe chaxingu TaxID=84603 RepID=A0A9W8JUQ3_9AGAR|nr:hypothetical protein NLJ89_g8815 [Agrocybe chaxingu]